MDSIDRRAIDGLEKRFKLCQDDLKQLVSDHQEQLRESDSESECLKNQVLVDCRSARREMLEVGSGAGDMHF